MSFFSVVGLGFLLGMRHATDPDHVVAVTTIVSRHRTWRDAAWVGAAWGVGHALTILGVGGAIVLFGWAVPARLGLSFEFAVGVMLVVLGVVTLYGSRSARGTLDRYLGSVRPFLLVRPLVVGIVHGLAGSAAASLLVLAVVQDPGWALAYLGVFGLGTVVGMMLVTTALAWPFASGASRSPQLGSRLRLGAGVLSIAFGVFLVYQVGMVDGLFAA